MKLLKTWYLKIFWGIILQALLIKEKDQPKHTKMLSKIDINCLRKEILVFFAFWKKKLILVCFILLFVLLNLQQKYCFTQSEKYIYFNCRLLLTVDLKVYCFIWSIVRVLINPIILMSWGNLFFETHICWWLWLVSCIEFLAHLSLLIESRGNGFLLRIIKKSAFIPESNLELKQLMIIIFLLFLNPLPAPSFFPLHQRNNVYDLDELALLVKPEGMGKEVSSPVQYSAGVVSSSIPFWLQNLWDPTMHF